VNIKDIRIKIVQADINRLKVDAIVDPAKTGKVKADCVIRAATAPYSGNPCWDQDIVRGAAAIALKRAQELKIKSMAFPPLGCDAGQFPLAGSAKIMIQEIMKISRDPHVSLKEIVFCLPDRETFEAFDKTARAYVHHILEDLGPGPYATVDIIIEFPQGIILVERSNPPYGWALPGGFLDRGESLEQAAVREAKEETNLDLVNMRQFHTYSDPGRDPRFQTISTVFIAESQGKPRSGDDAKNLKVVRYEDLPELDYAFDHKMIIKEYLIERNLD
jgi:8-oxo-dGTP diphosphatase